MTYSKHAAARTKQRGVPPIMVELLLRFGQREPSSNGAEIIYFNRDAKKKVESHLGGLVGKLNEHLNAYLVICNGLVVTVGPRFKRIKHI